jgi:hypothetical protein
MEIPPVRIDHFQVNIFRILNTRAKR